MRKIGLLLTAMGLSLAFTANPGFAKNDEQNLSKLGSFKRTDTGPMKRVAQGGKYVDNLRKVL